MESQSPTSSSSSSSISTLSNWTLHTQCFYPIGLKSYGTDKKCAIMVWNEKSLYTFIFRNFKLVLEQNLPPNKEHHSKGLSQICDIVPGSHETVILDVNGHLLHFESWKKIRKINYFHSVKSVCSTKDGFAMICFDDKQIHIQLHSNLFDGQDSANLGKKFDISFDENWPCTWWTDIKCNIKELDVKAPSLLKQEVSNEVFNFLYFSVNNTLFLLRHKDEDYEITQIQLFSSNIVDFWTDNDAIFVLLVSNVIEILYDCRLLNVLRKSTIYIGHGISCYSFSKNLFIYSDGEKCVQTKMEYCSTSNLYQKSVQTIQNVCGIVAISVIEEFNLVICVSDNRIFYKISLDLLEKDDIEQRTLVTDKCMEMLKTKAVDMVGLTSRYENIKEKIQIECSKFQIVAMKYNFSQATTKIVEHCFVAKLTAHKVMPNLKSPILPNTNEYKFLDHQYFVHIEIEKNLKLHKLFSSNLWNLIIRSDQLGQASTCKNIRLFSQAFSQTINVLLVFSSDLSFFYLPKIQIELISNVQIGNELICISFPVNCCPIKINHLFEIEPKIDLNDNEETKSSNLIYKIKLPKDIHFLDILRIFNTNSDSITSCYVITLLGRSIQLIYSDEHNLELRGHDPGTMYYVKNHILLNCMDKCGTSFSQDIQSFRELLTVQVNVNNLYADQTLPENVKLNLMKREIDKGREYC